MNKRSVVIVVAVLLLLIFLAFVVQLLQPEGILPAIVSVRVVPADPSLDLAVPVWLISEKTPLVPWGLLKEVPLRAPKFLIPHIVERDSEWGPVALFPFRTNLKILLLVFRDERLEVYEGWFESRRTWLPYETQEFSWYQGPLLATNAVGSAPVTLKIVSRDENGRERQIRIHLDAECRSCLDQPRPR